MAKAKRKPTVKPRRPKAPTVVLDRVTVPDDKVGRSGGDSDEARFEFFLWQSGMFGEYREDVRVNQQTALAYPVVWRCINYISRTIASLGWHEFQTRPDGGKDRILPADDDIAWLLDMQANPETTALRWRQVMVKDALCKKGGFSEIDRDGFGRPRWLWYIDADRVDLKRDGGGKLYYEVDNGVGNKASIIPPENMFVCQGLSPDGLVGYDTIAIARDAIRLGLQMEKYGTTYFRRGPMPGGILEVPGPVKDEERRAMRDSFEKAYGGAKNAGRVVVTSGGVKFSPMTTTNEDAQSIESREFQIEEICRIWGVPPHKVAHLDRSTNNNIEHQDMEAVRDCLLPWCRELETEANIKLFGRNMRGRRWTQLNLETLLRGDSATQTANLSTQVTSGMITLDEARDHLGYNPLPDGLGKTPLVQGAMIPLTSAVKGGAVPGDTSAGPGHAGAELIDVPDVPQQFDYDCGAAAAAAVSEWLEDPLPAYADYLRELGTTAKDGTAVASILDFFVRRGHDVEACGDLDIEELAEMVCCGRPVICPVQDYGTPEDLRDGRSGHYVVVVGVALGQVFVRDPSFSRLVKSTGDATSPHRVIAAEDFLADWHDVDADGTAYDRFGIAVGEEIEPPEPAPPPAKPAQPGADPAQPGARPAQDRAMPTQLADTFTGLLADAYGRLLRVETDKAKRAENKGELTRHVADYYTPDGTRRVAEAIRPVIAAMLLGCGRTADATEEFAATFAAYHAARSIEDLHSGVWAKEWANGRADEQARAHIRTLWEAMK